MLVVLAAPWVFSSSLGLNLLTQIGIAAIVCLGYNILLGQGGMLSFGHAIYFGLGAFVAIYALNAAVLPVSLVPIVGGLTGAAAAFFLGGYAVGLHTWPPRCNSSLCTRVLTRRALSGVQI